jgi:sugar lactone lactonase YvrE
MFVSLAACLFISPTRGAEPEYPLAIAVDAAGTAYVVDRNLPGVWKVADEKRSIYFQASKKFRTPLNAPRSCEVDADGRLLVGDSSTREVYRFGEDGQPVPLTKGGIGIPMGIAVTKSGDLLVSDLELHCIWRVPAAGGAPEKVVELRAPHGVAIDPDDRLWIVCHQEDQLVRLLPDGKVESVVKGQPFEFPHDVVLDAEGNAYVTDGYGKAVWKMPSGKEPEKLVQGEPFKNPVGMALRGDVLWVADPHLKQLVAVDLAGKAEPIPWVESQQ